MATGEMTTPAADAGSEGMTASATAHITAPNEIRFFPMLLTFFYPSIVIIDTFKAIELLTLSTSRSSLWFSLGGAY